MLVFEKSRPGRGMDIIPACDVPVVEVAQKDARESALHLPEISEVDLGRHYTELAKKCHGVNDGFYPLGSCTMKYNPRINEEMSNLPGFAAIHPLQPESTAQGALEVIQTLEKDLCEITGMDRLTLQPAAGAHGEFTGLLLIKAYHTARGDNKRTKVIVPDSAHGTNPASANMCGYEIINVESGPDGCVDLDKLKEVCTDEVAGLMLTNPNTVGLFDPNIKAITDMVHECGGLCYYDGANLNAVMGWARPGDMGFDVVHLNLHKTFSTPHGGGGPGSGPVGCKVCSLKAKKAAAISSSQHIPSAMSKPSTATSLCMFAPSHISRPSVAMAFQKPAPTLCSMPTTCASVCTISTTWLTMSLACTSSSWISPA